jgi:hypothetical protein
MLYYLENVELTECMTCEHSRYKPRTGRGKTLMAYKNLRYFSITPRLQRLFMSPRTAKHMTWHQSDADQPNTKRNHANDPLEVSIGPITRARAKKLKEALNGLV